MTSQIPGVGPEHQNLDICDQGSAEQFEHEPTRYEKDRVINQYS